MQGQGLGRQARLVGITAIIGAMAGLGCSATTEDGSNRTADAVTDAASGLPYCWSDPDGDGREVWHNASPEQITFTAGNVGERFASRIYMADFRGAWACQASSGGGRADRSDFAPAWAPGGRRLAFMSDREADMQDGTAGPDIYLVDVADGKARGLGCQALNPAGFPDTGDVYCEDENDCDAWLWSTPRYAPAFTPDGQRLLVFARNDIDSPYRIVSVPVDTGCADPDRVEELFEVPLLGALEDLAAINPYEYGSEIFPMEDWARDVRAIADLVDVDATTFEGLFRVGEHLFRSALPGQLGKEQREDAQQITNLLFQLTADVEASGIVLQPNGDGIAVATDTGVFIAERGTSGYRITKRFTLEALGLRFIGAGLSWVCTGTADCDDVLSFPAFHNDGSTAPQALMVRRDVLGTAGIEVEEMDLHGGFPAVAPYDLFWELEYGHWQAVYPGQNLIAYYENATGAIRQTDFGGNFDQANDVSVHLGSGSYVDSLSFRPAQYDRATMRWDYTAEQKCEWVDPFGGRHDRTGADYSLDNGNGPIADLRACFALVPGNS